MQSPQSILSPLLVHQVLKLVAGQCGPDQDQEKAEARHLLAENVSTMINFTAAEGLLYMIPSGQAHLPNSASQWGRFLRRRRCFPHSFSRSSHPKKSGMDAPPHSALRPERAKWKGETPLCFGHLSGNTRKMHLFMLKVGQQQKKGLALWFIEPSLNFNSCLTLRFNRHCYA